MSAKVAVEEGKNYKERKKGILYEQLRSVWRVIPSQGKPSSRSVCFQSYSMVVKTGY